MMLGMAVSKGYAQENEAIRSFKDHRSCLYGFINASGDTTVPAQYVYVRDVENGFYAVSNGVKTGLIRQRDGRLMLNFVYSALTPVKEGKRYARGWYVFGDGNSKGLLNLIKGEVHPAKYRYLPDEMRHGAFIAERSDSDYSLLDTLGHSQAFDGFKHVSLSAGPHFVAAQKDSLQALFSREGAQLTAFRFLNLRTEPNGHIFFHNRQSSGWINHRAEVFFEARKMYEKYYYHSTAQRHQILYKVKQHGAYTFGLLDTSKELRWTIPPEYDSLAANTDRNYVHGFKKGKQFLWDLSKECLLVSGASSSLIPKYGAYAYFVRKKKLLRVHLQEGKVELLGKAEACYANVHGEGVYPYWKKGGKWSLLRADGSTANFKADSIYPMVTSCEQVADTHVVCWNNGLLGITDTNGKPDETFDITQCDFNDLYEVQGETLHLFVNEQKAFAFFDECGNRVVLSARSGYMQGIVKVFYGMYRFIGLDRRSGLLSLEVGMLLEPRYSVLEALSADLFRVTFPNNEGDGLYSVAQKRFLVRPNQYPIFEISHDLERVRYGFTDSLCLLDFDGQIYAEWEQVADLTPYGDGYLVVAVDSFEVGLKSERRWEKGRWLVPPKYCAFSEYRKDKGLASVRACPMYLPDEDALQDGEGTPTVGNWGLVDSTGAWVIPPFSRYPIEVYNQVQVLIDEEGEHYLYHLSGKRLWKKGYAIIREANEMEGQYWVHSADGKIGLRTLAGEWSIPLIYNEVIVDADNGTYIGILQADTTFEEVHVFQYNSRFDSTEPQGLERMRLLYKHLGQDEYAEGILEKEYEKEEVKEALEEWYYPRWFMNRSQEESHPLDEVRVENYGFCHPAFRVNPEWGSWISRSRGWSEELVYWDVQEHSCGVSMTASREYCHGGYGGPAQCYNSESFYNLKLVNGTMKPLRLWDVLDSTQSDLLIDTLIARVNASNLELDCAQNGNYIEVAKKSFQVSKDRIYLYLPHSERSEEEAIEENYLVVSLPLKAWARKEW